MNTYMQMEFTTRGLTIPLNPTSQFPFSVGGGLPTCC